MEMSHHNQSESPPSSKRFLKLHLEEIEKNSIYVGNVDYTATNEELENYFCICGSVKRVTILRNKFNQQPKGYAFIEFHNECSAKIALIFDGSEFLGREIKVKRKRKNITGLSWYIQRGPRRNAGRGDPRGLRRYRRGSHSSPY